MVKFTGETVDEAIDKGLATLEISRTKASIRVLSRGKKGLFGLGRRPAEVDVEVINHSTVSKADRDIVRNLPRQLRDQETSEELLEQEKLESRKVTSIINYLEKRGKIVNDNVKSEMLDARRSVTAILSDLLPDEIVEEYRRKKEELDQKGLDWDDDIALDEEQDDLVDDQENLSESDEAQASDLSEARDEEFESFINSEFDQVEQTGQKDIEEATRVVSSYVQEILDNMDVEASVEASHSGKHMTLQIETGEAGRVIGYHGKVLKSIQILAQNLLHDQFTRHFSVTINVHDYIERRMETLSDYAKKVAHEVVESGQSFTMDTMSNDERKAVHKTISTIPGVSSYSEGADPKRYVVVVPKSE